MPKHGKSKIVQKKIQGTVKKLDNLKLEDKNSSAESGSGESNDLGPLTSLFEKKAGKEKTLVQKEETLTSNSDDLVTSFEDMNLGSFLLKGIYKNGMEKPSPLQQRAIVPCVSGKDAVIQGQSGMGKTACLVISTIQRLLSLQSTSKKFLKPLSTPGCLAVVLVPVRELALQIQGEFKRIGVNSGITSITCIGGTNIRDDINALKKGVHVVVGTPGRIFSLIKESKAIPRVMVKLLVVDEADKVLEDLKWLQPNYSNAFENIIEQKRHHITAVSEIFKMFSNKNEPTPSGSRSQGQGQSQKPAAVGTQIILASATFPPNILKLAKSYLKPDHLTILVKNEDLTLEGINQYYLNVGSQEFKVATLLDIYPAIVQTNVLTIIFCNLRTTVDMLRDEIRAKGHSMGQILAIHAEMDQERRNEISRDFRCGRGKILLASDIFGRGIDIQQLRLVINFDLPQTTEQYMHRVGRGGRFGRTGVAITFTSSEEELKVLKRIETFYATEIPPLPKDALSTL